MMVDKNLMTWMVTDLNMSYVPGLLWDSYYTKKKKQKKKLVITNTNN